MSGGFLLEQLTTRHLEMTVDWTQLTGHGVLFFAVALMTGIVTTSCFAARTYISFFFTKRVRLDYWFAVTTLVSFWVVITSMGAFWLTT